MIPQTNFYNPALDGLRALAVIFVVLYHLNLLPGGFLGVDIFFVLSGYWITRMLLRESTKNGGLHLPSFLYRRLRRILPAMLLTIVLITLLLWLADDSKDFSLLARNRHNVWSSLLFFNNWQQIFSGESYVSLFEPSYYRHFWSLAIEGQFYVVWTWMFCRMFRRMKWGWGNQYHPASLPQQARRTWALPAFTIMLFAAFFYAIQLPFLPPADQAIVSCQASPGAFFHFPLPFELCISRLDFFYLGTFTKLWPLACGIALALCCSGSHTENPRTNARSLSLFANISLQILAGLSLYGMLYLVGTMQIHNLDGSTMESLMELPTTQTISKIFSPLLYQGFPLIAIATAFLIYSVSVSASASQQQQSSVGNQWPPHLSHSFANSLSNFFARFSLARLLGSRPLVWLGQRSYGVYLYHWPVILAVQDPKSLLISWPESHSSGFDYAIVGRNFLCIFGKSYPQDRLCQLLLRENP